MDRKTRTLRIISFIILCGLIITGSVCMPALISQAGLFSYAAGQENDEGAVSDDAGSKLIEAIDDVSLPANEEIRSLTFIEDDNYKGMKHISYPFLDTAEVAYDWSFPYSDEFFRHPSDQFSINMARGSLGMALCSFRSTKNVVPPQYKSYLSGAGFVRVNAFGYEKPTEQDSLSGVIGMRKIDDFTVIAVVTCGQGYQNEWAGNLLVGDSERHEGFDAAAALLRQHIDDYIKSNGITGKKKIWINGISRAAAIGNLAAADLIESGEYEDVYAYLYGVPRTTKAPVNYPGIYNICGQFDPVSATPLQSWGYERYGTDIYTPSQEADEGYFDRAIVSTRVSQDLTGKAFRNNPEINRQLYLILEYFGRLFPTSADYADRFQSILLDVWKDPNSGNITDILSQAMSRLETVSAQENTSRRVFLEYLSYMVGEHMRAEQNQVAAGSWAPDESLAANLVLEHRPSTYVNWIFSDIAPEDLFLGSDESRRLTFIGNVSVEVYEGNQFIGSVDRRGVHVLPGDASVNVSVTPGPFMERKGSQTIISLPAQTEYQLKVTAAKRGNLTYYDQTTSSKRLLGDPGRMYAGSISPGTCSLVIQPDQPLAELKDDTAKFSCLSNSEFEYLPTVIMSNELGATRFSYMTVKSVLQLIGLVALVLHMILFINLIIFAVHKWKVKKSGHGPYSDWYVIVPHLICILLFMLLTQYLTFFMFTVGQARAVCAAVTISFIFMLSLRGLIRRKNKRSIITTLVMLALVPLSYKYYNMLSIDSFSYVNMAVYYAVIILLTVAAVRTFKDQVPRAQAPGPL